MEAVSEILCRKRIPIVSISGFNDEKTKSAVKNLKPCDFLKKPCNAREINNVINSLSD